MTVNRRILSFNAPTKGDIVLGSAPVSFGNTFTLEGDIYSYGTSKFDFDGKITGDSVTKLKHKICKQRSVC